MGAGIMAAREASAIYGTVQLLLTVRVFGVALLLMILAGALLSRRTNTRFPLRWWPVLAAVGVLDVGAVLALLIATRRRRSGNRGRGELALHRDHRTACLDYSPRTDTASPMGRHSVGRRRDRYSRRRQLIVRERGRILVDADLGRESKF